MKSQQFDYIIVGAGIAGVTLAMQLHKAGKRILLYTGTKENVSSYVAAGLYNPITGRKLIKTWMADDLFHYLEDFYLECERLFEGKFLYQKEIYRPFVNAEEQNEWMGKSADEAFKNFIGTVHTKSTSEKVDDPHGGLALKSSGFVDIPTFIESALTFFSQQHKVLNEDFRYHELVVTDTDVTYGSYRADKIVFCEGIGVLNNPFFSWLPLRPVKGEIIYIKANLDFNYILNRGVFVLPIGNDTYKVGSTYDHHDLTLKPTEKAKNQILQKLDQILDCEYEIVDHAVGIRPATKDRRPFAGIHPKVETIAVFNGLGTKGVSLAPYWAQHLMQHLEHNKKLSDEVNISRYFSLYSESHVI